MMTEEQLDDFCALFELTYKDLNFSPAFSDVFHEIVATVDGEHDLLDDYDTAELWL